MPNQLAWHFLPNNGCLRFGKREKVRAGRVYRADGPLVLCENGMHASVDPLDALSYAPGAIICRVEMRGETVIGGDKLCSRERKVLWKADATRTLHEFAIWCATRALKRAQVTDKRCWNALRVRRLWLDGRATDDELLAARDAAGAAEGLAAWAAERKAQSRKLAKMLEALHV